MNECTHDWHEVHRETRECDGHLHHDQVGEECGFCGASRDHDETVDCDCPRDFCDRCNSLVLQTDLEACWLHGYECPNCRCSK